MADALRGTGLPQVADFVQNDVGTVFHKAEVAAGSVGNSLGDLWTAVRHSSLSDIINKSDVINKIQHSSNTPDAPKGILKAATGHAGE